MPMFDTISYPDGEHEYGKNVQTIATPSWLTIPMLKEVYLHGVIFKDADNRDITPNALATHIRNAVSLFERELQTYFSVRRVRANADRRDLPPDTFDIDEEPYDWHPEDYGDGSIVIRLRNKPVKAVHSVSLHVPNGQKVIEYPEDWIHLDRKLGLLRIFAYGTSGVRTFPYSGFPYMTTGWGGNRPGALWVDYDAGLDRPSEEIIDKMAKYASVMILDVLSDAISAGIASYSVSLDGLSTSIGTTSSAAYNIYTPRRQAYMEELAAWYQDARDHLRGIRWTVL